MPNTTHQAGRLSRALLAAVRFLASMPVAVVLLCLLALTSTIGTVLVQNRDEDFYLSNIGPTWYRIFDALGFLDMYSAGWFIAILLLLILSVSAALVRHGPRFWRTSRPLDAMRPWPAKHDGGFTATVQEAQQIETTLRRHGFNEFKGDGELLLARKGRHSKLGFFFVHASVVLIGIGGLLTSQVGFRGVMNIPEGESDNVIYIPEGRDYRRLQLPFQVRNDKFAIDFYNTGMPSEFRSDLSLVQEGKVLAQKRITVNDPLRYEGITFYQSNFGDAGSQVNFTLRDLTNERFPRQAVETTVGRTLEDGMGIKLQVKELRQHNVVNMSEDPEHEKLTNIGPSLDLLLQSPASGNISYRVYLAYPHMLAFAPMGSDDMIYENLGFSPADDQLMGLLAAYLKQVSQIEGEVDPDKRRAAFAAALGAMNISTDRAAELGPAIIQAETVLRAHKLPMVFAFSSFVPKQYTGLQVARDPGAPLIWIGSAIMVLGLFMMLYWHEYRIWVRRNGNSMELCALYAARQKLPLERLLAKLENDFTTPATHPNA
ncbi:MAG TPA: cytochrome c biogenesis protein ResB [Gammaproteobacteria bacterium]